MMNFYFSTVLLLSAFTFCKTSKVLANSDTASTTYALFTTNADGNAITSDYFKTNEGDGNPFGFYKLLLSDKTKRLTV